MDELLTTNVKFLNRFALVRQLGIGGMGVVYSAYDRERNEHVAIKTLRNAQPSDLYRLKKEFRSLIDLLHPNLVKLYELFSEGDVWFFTMELIEGVDFLSYVRNGPFSASDSSSVAFATHTETITRVRLVTDPRPFDNPSQMTQSFQTTPNACHDDQANPRLNYSQSALTPVQLMRLRSALGQLAEGIIAVHDVGKLHRDIKPSNVIVTRDGRVVLLDFGLAHEIHVPAYEQSAEDGIVGTVEYMAPEQAAGRDTTPASDWYSVGVMLFESLTGRRPFVGSKLQVLMDKQQCEPPPPSEIVEGTPQDLDLLAGQLLRRDPSGRPSGREVLRRLGRECGSGGESARSRSSSIAGTTLVGRDEELQMIQDALNEIRQGRPCVINVSGESGLGKSAILDEFKRQLQRDEDVVLLSGRCYERESVPFKAMDSLVDALSRYMSRLNSAEVEAILPRETHALSRLFPVLRRVSAVAATRYRQATLPHQQEQRTRAFAALRELLSRLGDRKVLVLVIDDMQWGDLDSVALLNDLLRPPDAPVALLVTVFRSEDESTSPILAALRESQESIRSACSIQDLKIKPLTEASARELAVALLDSDFPQIDPLSARIARESGGHPYFIDALVRHYQLHDSRAEASADLDDVLWEQVVQLSDAPRKLLETVSVAGHPLSQNDAVRAAELNENPRHVLDLLRIARLVRTTGKELHDHVEVFHDRIRETVTARLSKNELVQCHERLAVCLESTGRTEPAVLAAHFLEAENQLKASEYYAIAADQSSNALAFDRSAHLYGLAIQHGPGDQSYRRSLVVKLADSLANAGRGGEAAQRYVEAAQGATAAEALEFRRRAATQSLISGHIDEGIKALTEVLASVGLRLPNSPLRSLVAMLIQRGMLRLRGLRFQRRDPSQLSAEALAQIDIFWSVSTGLSIVDTIRAAGFQSRGLRLALHAGEPYRIARSLSLEAAHVAVIGHRVAKRVETLLKRCEQLAQESGSNHAIGLAALMSGLSAFLQGRWKDAIELCDQSEAIFRDECTGVAWELTTAQGFGLWSLFYAGEVAELSLRVPKLMREANERGNIYALNNFGSFAGPLVHMAADDPETGQRELLSVTAQWSQDGFHVQHLTSAFGRAMLDIYMENGPLALEHLDGDFPALRRSMLLRIQQIRVVWNHVYGRAALLAAAQSPEPRSFLDKARRMSRTLEREAGAWPAALAELLRAGIASFANQKSVAIDLLESATSKLNKVDMSLFAASGKRRLGQLTGGEAGASLIRGADAWMANQKIKNPARMAAAHVPGNFPD